MHSPPTLAGSQPRKTELIFPVSVKKKPEMLTICNRNFCAMNLNICDRRYTEYLFKHGILTLVDLFAVRTRPGRIAVNERLNGRRVTQTPEVLLTCEINAGTRQAGKVLYTTGPNN